MAFEEVFDGVCVRFWKAKLSLGVHPSILGAKDHAVDDAGTFRWPRKKT